MEPPDCGEARAQFDYEEPNQERAFLNGLLQQRFSFSIVGFSLIVTAGAAASPLSELKFVLAVGLILCLMLAACVYRIFVKVDGALALLHRFQDGTMHRVAAFSEKRRWPLFSVNTWIGQWIPLFALAAILAWLLLAHVGVIHEIAEAPNAGEPVLARAGSTSLTQWFSTLGAVAFGVLLTFVLNILPNLMGKAHVTVDRLEIKAASQNKFGEPEPGVPLGQATMLAAFHVHVTLYNGKTMPVSVRRPELVLSDEHGNEIIRKLVSRRENGSRFGEWVVNLSPRQSEHRHWQVEFSDAELEVVRAARRASIEFRSGRRGRSRRVSLGKLPPDSRQEGSNTH